MLHLSSSVNLYLFFGIDVSSLINDDLIDTKDRYAYLL